MLLELLRNITLLNLTFTMVLELPCCSGTCRRSCFNNAQSKLGVRSRWGGSGQSMRAISCWRYSRFGTGHFLVLWFLVSRLRDTNGINKPGWLALLRLSLWKMCKREGCCPQGGAMVPLMNAVPPLLVYPLPYWAAHAWYASLWYLTLGTICLFVQ